MVKRIGISLALVAGTIMIGCAGAGNAILNQLNPFAGSYSGTLTYTSSTTDEPLTLNVNGSGRVTGSFTDPSLGIGTLAGQVDTNGSVTGTTLNGSTAGTFNLTLTSGSANHFTGSGTFTPGSTAKPVTLDVTKS